ncbi:hypothetical protein FQB35_03560 [Crassaminicella thermophila]|uniref:PH domain-containing protein n=1 Tax=Crassaminicella thermophila TaxID=2599308 RepID=A0A5C0SE24_CRATE|nr:hypothetical protein [Crassaminicella thermophila]QEK11524.1 hypothetical protein FQB35_03560 [Crassaminicella thermophila]
MSSAKIMKSWETMKTWPKKIQFYEEIPDIFKEHFQLLDGCRQFPYTIFVPPNKWSKKNKDTKLISVFDDRIYVYKECNKKIEIICYKFEEICYTEIGSILLDSWIKICGEVNNQFKSSTIGFNTVREDLFLPIVKKIRESINKIESCDTKNELSKLDYLKTLDLKFFNYSKQSILLEEKVINVVYQPEINEKYFKYFRKRKTNAHMMILTNTELILIREDYGSKKDKSSKLGGIWDYIPLKKIKSLIIEKNNEENDFVFWIKLLNNESIYSIFSSSNEKNVDSLIEGFKHLINEWIK